jgi:hypothetical protein
VNGNLYWNNSNGVPVQITAGNGLNFASLGTIGGDYGAAGVTASAVYTDSLKTFSWLQAASQYAKMGMADLSLYSTTASTLAVTLKANAATAAYDFVMPVAAPAANTIMRMALGGQGSFVSLLGTANQITVTQNTSDITLSIPNNPVLTGIVSSSTGFAGPGIVPVGAIIAMGDVGAYALPASGAIKDGWALCNGQAKPVGSATGIAANLPDLTDDRFLNGSSAVGGTGGATSKITTGIAASFAKNLLNTDQIGHIHGMQHIHQWSSFTGTPTVYSSFNATGGTINFATYTGSVDIAAGGAYRRTDWATGTGFLYTAGAKESGTLLDRTHTDSQTVSWFAGPTVSTTVTQGTISDIRPKYFNVVYLMRVA